MANVKSASALRLKKLRKSGFLLSILAYPLLHFIVFYLIVNTNAILLAFQRVNTNFEYEWVGFANFKQIWTELTSPEILIMRINIRNSLLFYAAHLIIGTPLHLLIAFLMFKKIRFSGVFRIIVMIPSMISGMVMALIFERLMYALPTAFQRMGITFPNMMNDQKYVFLTIVFYSLWTGYGSSVIMYPNAMNAINKEIIEASKLDGCTPLQEFFRIVIPLILPTITTYTVTGFAGIFGAQGANYVFWGTHAPAASSTMGYYLHAQVLASGSIVYGYCSALGILCTIVTFPLTMLIKWFLEKVDPVNE